MKQYNLVSNRITAVFEGTNSLLFKFDGSEIVYNRLTNHIHKGNRDELLRIIELAESVDYLPKYDSTQMKNKSKGFIDQLILNMTESCDLACSYCINDIHVYPMERDKSNKYMNWNNAKKAVDFFLPQANENAYIAFYGGEATRNFEIMLSVMNYAKNINPDIKFSITTKDASWSGSC